MGEETVSAIECLGERCSRPLGSRHRKKVDYAAGESISRRGDGDFAAAAGWAHAREGLIYVIDTHRSAISVGLGADCLSLSPNGRYLAAGLHTAGLRVFDRNRQWVEIFKNLRDLAHGYGS